MIELTVLYSFALITADEFEKLFAKRGYSIGSRMDVEVGVGQKLIVGFRAIMVAVKPSGALDDHYHIVGPAIVTLKPVGEDVRCCHLVFFLIIRGIQGFRLP